MRVYFRGVPYADNKEEKHKRKKYQKIYDLCQEEGIAPPHEVHCFLHANHEVFADNVEQDASVKKTFFFDIESLSKEYVGLSIVIEN